MATFKEKNIAIGEWPEYSEAEITPFMKVLLGADERGRALIRKAEQLDLLDLTQASDEDLAAVAELVWKVKGLFYALVSGKASDVMARLESGMGVKVKPQLIANLTASIPARCDYAGAAWSGCRILARKWPIARMRPRRAVLGGRRQSRSPNYPHPFPPIICRQTDSLSYRMPMSWIQALSFQAARNDKPAQPIRLAQAEVKNVSPEEEKDIQTGRWRVDAFGRLIKGPGDESSSPEAEPADSPIADADPASDSADAAVADSDAVESDPAVESEVDPPEAEISPAVAVIESEIDAESWAEYGGWYRRDFAIFYRPVGHKDKFIYSWLEVTGPQAPRGDGSPSAAVFDYLTGKDAQGQCANVP